MKNINYKSDFDFLLRLRDGNGNEVGWPDYDWRAVFWTVSRARKFEASCVGGVCVNCYNDNGLIHVVCDGAALGPGQLRCEFRALLPDDKYPDGNQVVVTPEALGITLVSGATDVPTQLEAEAVLPYIKGQKGDTGETGGQGQKGDKGDPFTYDDFTEAQKAELMRPATDAATALAEKEREFENAEKTRAANVRTAISDAETATTDASSAATYTRGVGDGYADAVEEAKVKVFRDLWNAACGKYGCYNEQTGFYELNGITDIGYEEALEIYNAGPITGKYLILRYAALKGRTNLPMNAKGSWASGTSSVLNGYNVEAMVYNKASGIEVLNLESQTYNNFVIESPGGANVHCFSGGNLRKIIGILVPVRFREADGSTIFGGCPNLCEFNMDIHYIPAKSTLTLSGCPKLNLTTFSYMVMTAKAVSSFTILVHPDVYAKLTDESNTEWHKVLTDAAAKNISFATI